MQEVTKEAIDAAVDWGRSTFGQFDPESDQSRIHGHRVSATHRVRTESGYAFLKIHASRPHWEAEVHAYERWSGAFGDAAPRLLAVRDAEPLGLVFSEIEGTILEELEVNDEQEDAIWMSAGRALAELHAIQGDFFGPTDRSGEPRPDAATDAVDGLTRRFSDLVDRADVHEMLSLRETAAVREAGHLIPSFADESPTACHRDYCASNWLIDSTGVWVGVIDFEFSHWDVRVADFTRDPHWSWMKRPSLLDAFFEGYGRSPVGPEKDQMLFAHVEYALGAIVWGQENEFFGFAREGHEALEHLATRL